ncbi:hypothetical protein L917_12041, partial [Phytophthora nicotianae]
MEGDFMRARVVMVLSEVYTGIENAEHHILLLIW